MMKILRDERDKVAKRLSQLGAALKALGEGSAVVKTKRTWKMSAAARAKISAAQKKRWAKLKK
jgi:hypothetical protein